MKQLKLIIFVFILVLVQTLLSVYVNIYGIVPNVMLSFVIAYAMCGKELSYSIGASLLCGIMMSALSGRQFFMVMLIFLYSGVLSYMSENARRKVPKWVKTAVFTAVFTLVGESIIYLLTNLTFSMNAFMGIIIPTVMINSLFSVPMYFITRRFFCGAKKRHKHIIL